MSDKFRFIFERPADCYAIGLTRDVVEKMRPAVSLDDIPADERVNACQAELMSHLMTAYDDLAPASYFAACSVTLILLHALGKLDACLAPDVAGVGVFLEYRSGCAGAAHRDAAGCRPRTRDGGRRIGGVARPRWPAS